MNQPPRGIKLPNNFTNVPDTVESSSDGKSLERISKLHGEWILVKLDYDAMVDFNGLPESMRRNDRNDETKKDPAKAIWVPPEAMERAAELEEFEKVYTVEKIGDKVKDCPVKEGELVLVKGTVIKAYTNPILFFVGVGNIAASVDLSDRRGKSKILTR